MPGMVPSRCVAGSGLSAAAVRAAAGCGVLLTVWPIALRVLAARVRPGRPGTGRASIRRRAAASQLVPQRAVPQQRLGAEQSLDVGQCAGGVAVVQAGADVRQALRMSVRLVDGLQAGQRRTGQRGQQLLPADLGRVVVQRASTPSTRPIRCRSPRQSTRRDAGPAGPAVDRPGRCARYQRRGDQRMQPSASISPARSSSRSGGTQVAASGSTSAGGCRAPAPPRAARHRRAVRDQRQAAPGPEPYGDGAAGQSPRRSAVSSPRPPSGPGTALAGVGVVGPAPYPQLVGRGARPTGGGAGRAGTAGSGRGCGCRVGSV